MIAVGGQVTTCEDSQNERVPIFPRSFIALCTSAIGGMALPGPALEHGAGAVSFNNSESIVFLEYALEASKIAGEQGLLRVAHTNGYWSANPAGIWPRPLMPSALISNPWIPFSRPRPPAEP